MIQKLYRFYNKYIWKNFKGKRGVWRGRHEIRKKLLRKVPDYEEEPENPYEKEWDNLFILDAARHDLYEEVNGSTEKRTSLGGQSAEYVEKAFSEGDFSDIVYITGNPHFNPGKFKEFTGRDIEDVFHEVFHTYMEDWDEEENTVMPEALIRDAKTAKKLFPDKKIVVHFMQPHYPFVDSEFTRKGIRPDLNSEKAGFSIWEEAEMGEHNKEELWKAYKENLEFVLPKVKELAEELGGKTAITADHGNLVGEKGIYGHPRGLKAKPLREVPWHVIEHENE